MIRQLDITSFLQQTIPILDVRTPAEFKKGHIPGAINFPLFTDEERVIVGTLYKQQGKNVALLKGLELVGPRLATMVSEVEKITQTKEVFLHCWRGGMRSNSVAWLLDIAGFKVSVLKGGYKVFRQWVISQWEIDRDLYILGGMTGCGKTEVLKSLGIQGEQVIDLEDLAQHQGSAFGSMGKLIQPSQEHFENLLAMKLAECDRSKKIWLEDESITIGQLVIPNPLWHQMRNASLVRISLPLTNRVDILVKGYSGLDPEFLKESIAKITKKLGGQHAKTALEALDKKDYEEVVRIVLAYYDKAYAKGQSKREASSITEIELTSKDPSINAKIILDRMN